MTVTPPITTLSIWRLLVILIQFREKNVRERADIFLFGAGLIVEYVLLFALFGHYAGSGLIAAANYIVMLALFFALAVHQFLIFRNSTLQYTSPGDRLDLLELLICLSFGVLTGELGYLLVLAISSKPEWLVNVPIGVGWMGALSIVLSLAAVHVASTKRESGRPVVSKQMIFMIAAVLGVILIAAVRFDRSDFAIRGSNRGLEWAFAPDPLVINASNAAGVADGGGLAMEAIKWFANGLGRLLKAVFAFGAMALSFLILAWDWRVKKTFEAAAATAKTASDHSVQLRGNRLTLRLFFVMDGLSAFTWAMVLGVVFPSPYQESCFHLLLLVSFAYAVVAWYRLSKGKETFEALSSEPVAATTVI